MPNLHQLTFDFNVPIMPLTGARQRVSWRIRALVQRHHLPLAQAAIIAAEIGIQEGEIR